MHLYNIQKEIHRRKQCKLAAAIDLDNQDGVDFGEPLTGEEVEGR